MLRWGLALIGVAIFLPCYIVTYRRYYYGKPRKEMYIIPMFLGLLTVIMAFLIQLDR